MGRIEGRLFNFGEVILGIAIQYDSSDRHQWVVAMRPYLGHIKRIEAVLRRLGRRHDLHFERPRRIVALVDRTQQIALMIIGTVILEQDRSREARSPGVLIIGNRGTAIGRYSFF